MTSASDSWMQGFNEASKLAEDIKGMIAESSSLSPSGPETWWNLSTAWSYFCQCFLIHSQCKFSSGICIIIGK